jgi:competence protein ComEA
MPTRTGRPDAAAELATRLAELRLPTVAPARAAPPVSGGWLPEQPRPAASPPVIAAPIVAPPLSSLVGAWVDDRLPLWARGLTGRVSRGAVLALAVVVVVVAVGTTVVLHHRSASPAYAGSTWPGSTSPTSASSAADSGSSAASVTGGATADSASSDSIVVDVAGKVRRPGLVTLPPGSRVADAIAAAGGALRHRDIATTDLAAKVGDGQLLLIGVTGSGSTGTPGDSSTGGTTSGSGSSAPVSLSSADLTTLETLPGVGPVTAQKIIDWRTAHNGFTSIEQLQQVPGIGPAHYAEVEALVTP